MKIDGMGEAFIGLAHQFTSQVGLAYSKTKILKILVERDGMSEEDALGFFEFNIEGAWIGEGTPIIVDDTISLDEAEKEIEDSAD